MAYFVRNQSYFEWMRQKVYDDGHPMSYSYKRLLSYLYEKEYQWTIEMDSNRAADGVSLRYQYAFDHGIPYSEIDAEVASSGPCTVLEMLVALAMKCEVMMSNPAVGDRTGVWFWLMISNLGFSQMPDHSFDRVIADHILARFFSNQYSPEGFGGLFTIPGIQEDLRSVDIYTQMYWYIDAMFPDEVNFHF